MEYPIPLLKGDQRTISRIWEVLPEAEGAPARIFGTCQDITDSRRARGGICQTEAGSVGTPASGIAQDVHNLLGGVLARSELALTECAAEGYPERELKISEWGHPGIGNRSSIR